MFIDDKELIEIKVYYKKIGRHYIAFSSPDFEKTDFGLFDGEKDEKLSALEQQKVDEERKKKVNEEKAKYKVVTIKAKQLTWGLYNELQEDAVVKDNLGARVWNYKKYKENKLKKVIAEWDVKIPKDDGSMITAPITPAAIANLSPDVAEAILSAYDQAMVLSDEDEKK